MVPEPAESLLASGDFRAFFEREGSHRGVHLRRMLWDPWGIGFCRGPRQMFLYEFNARLSTAFVDT